MSFSSEVKKELVNFNAPSCCLKAELYGIVKFKSKLIFDENENMGIIIKTMHNFVARRILSLFKKVYNIEVKLKIDKRQKLDYKTQYSINLSKNSYFVLFDLLIIDDKFRVYEQINFSLLKSECCKAALLRGLFLTQGSINDPNDGHYHLEIVLDNNATSSNTTSSNTTSSNESNNTMVKKPTKSGVSSPVVFYITKILKEVGICIKVIKRTKGIVLYLKKSEQIGDFLKFIGAVNNLFYFEDKRIKKDYNNSVNRVMNCDIANEEKAIRSAHLQLENIQFLTKHQGFVNLTQRLTDAIILRTTFPDDSLSQLSENSYETIGKFISKSGLSHCYNDIKKLCDEIKGKK